MAGDWIKFEENTPDKPEVYGMAAELGIEPDAVVGKLLRVWSWASRNCPASGRTDVRAIPAIDRVANATGFAAAMQAAGWLLVTGAEVHFPNFDRHCTQTAKERALDAKRKRESRQKASGECPVADRTELGPEKRREKKREENTDRQSGDAAAPNAPAVKKKPTPKQIDQEWLDDLAQDATYAHCDIPRELGKMSRWCETNRKQKTRSRFINWLNRIDRPMSTPVDPLRGPDGPNGELYDRF